MATRARIELVTPLADGSLYHDALTSRISVPDAYGLTITADASADPITSYFYPWACIRTIRYYTGELVHAEINTKRDDPVPEV